MLFTPARSRMANSIYPRGSPVRTSPWRLWRSHQAKDSMGTHSAQSPLLGALLTLMADSWYNASCWTASFLTLGLGDTKFDVPPTYIWPHVRRRHSPQHCPHHIYVRVARNPDIWGKDGGICNQRSTKVADSSMLARIHNESNFRIVSFLTSWVQKWTTGNQSDSVDGTMYVIITGA